MKNFILKNKKNILIILLILINLFLVFYIFQKNNINVIYKDVEKYSLIDPARSLIEQKHFFSTIQPLRENIIRVVENYEQQGHSVGVYIEYLNTGANISVNQDKRFWPASLSKMPTAFIVMKKVQDGKWNLKNELVLFEEDKDSRFGDLHREIVGTTFSVEELLKELLIKSDNTAHKIFVRNSSSLEYEEMISALGMEQLFDKNYDISAKEYSRIFRSLYSASYLNREYSQMMLNWLSETKFENFLQSGLPEDVKFSHKIGEEFEQNVFLDSGIIYIPERPVLITVMIKVKEGEGIQKANEIMKLISEETYNYVANY